ncbi:iron ABC transporter permease [Janibacter cremeus]|uniref:ABC transporter permease n=1 Tax=Janibacter cremeus TaxID=1285192 RepID=UPI0023F85CCF|nr:iron ABC transporter permease [Janibacter cremeus]WEV78082.1 iron ABC transporter permease [Janibacter cremeus]
MPASSKQLVTAAAILVAAVTLLPIAVVAADGMAASPRAVLDYLLRPHIGELLGNTVVLVLVTVPACLVLGVGAAWLVERTDLAFAGVWRVALGAPLAVPAFVASYAWISIWPGLDGLGGAALVTTAAYFPFVYLPVAAILRDLDASPVEDARALGATPFAAWWRTVLPRLRPAASGGALLVALHLLAEFGVLEMMRYQTFTTAILVQYEVSFNSHRGSLLALVLTLLCLTVLTFEHLLRGTARTSRVGRGVHRRADPVRLGRWSPIATTALGLVVVIALVVPVTTVGRWLLAHLTTPDTDAFPRPSLLLTTGSSVSLALAAAALATAMAFPGAWLLSRRRTGWTMLLERATYVASSLPGAVIGLAMITLTVSYLPGIYQSPFILVLGYTILFIPRAMISLRAGLAAAPPELGEAARSLGTGPVGAFRRVVLPLMLPSVLTGAALVAIAAATELTATLLLAPTGTSTLATAFWAASDEFDYVGAAPYAAMMILLSAPLTVLMLRQSGIEQ